MYNVKIQYEHKLIFKQMYEIINGAFISSLRTFQHIGTTSET